MPVTVRLIQWAQYCVRQTWDDTTLDLQHVFIHAGRQAFQQCNELFCYVSYTLHHESTSLLFISVPESHYQLYNILAQDGIY